METSDSIALELLSRIDFLSKTGGTASRIQRVANRLKSMGHAPMLTEIVNNGSLSDCATGALLEVIDLTTVSGKVFLRLLNSTEGWARVWVLRALQQHQFPDAFSKLLSFLSDREEITDLWTTYRIDRLAALALKFQGKWLDRNVQVWLSEQKRELPLLTPHNTEEAILFLVEADEITEGEALGKLKHQPSEYFWEALQAIARKPKTESGDLSAP